jgi:hypothetical protein
MASIALLLARASAWVASPSYRCKRSYSAFVLFACALATLMAAKPARAQGTVTGVNVTTSVSTITVPVNTPATFTATSTAGTPNPDQYWTVIAGPNYSWGGYGAHDPATTTLSYTFSTAGTYTVSPSCLVSYTVQYARGTTAIIDETASAAKPVTIYVIGGPISGENNIYWFLDPNKSTDWGHLSAASGQPAGTTYSWSIAGSARLTSSATSASVTYCGSGTGSSKPGDVAATLTYSLNGVSATSPPFPITVHAPTQFIVQGTTPPTAITSGANAYGFDGQSLRFQIRDGLNQPVTSARSACWDEIWKGDGTAPANIGDVLDITGVSTDRFWWHGFPQPINPSGDTMLGPFTHTYYVTDDGGGASGGGVGCPVQVYTNVIYKTYGVVGNGF